MKKLLIPLILMLVGVGGGVGAGLFLAPPKEDVLAENPCGDVTPVAEETTPDTPAELPVESREYAKLSNQFIVPIVDDGLVTSMVIMSLSIEVEAGGTERIFSHEPRLRNAFLQVLFDHANMGGFDGAFTASSNMRILREALRETATQSIGGDILDVLIVDILRQDVTR